MTWIGHLIECPKCVSDINKAKVTTSSLIHSSVLSEIVERPFNLYVCGKINKCVAYCIQWEKQGFKSPERNIWEIYKDNIIDILLEIHVWCNYLQLIIFLKYRIIPLFWLAIIFAIFLFIIHFNACLVTCWISYINQKKYRHSFVN